MQASFNQYWKLATSCLTTDVILGLLRPNRTRPEVAEPLLKTLFILQLQDFNLESDTAVVLLDTLKSMIAKEQTNMGLIKVAAMNIVRLMEKVPAAHDQSLETLRELVSSLQEVIKRCFVSDDS